MTHVDTDGNRMIWDERLRQWVPVTGSMSPAELANEIQPILSKRFAPVRPATIVTLGDSFMVGSASDWTTMFIPATKGRLRRAAAAGVSGNTSSQMLARLSTDVIAYAPSYCLVGAVTPNDPAQSVNVATTKANIVAIVAALAGAGITPLLVLGPPSDTTAYRDHIANVNGWLRFWGPANGYRVLDPYQRVTDPTDGTWLSTYTADGIHPNALGAKLMGFDAAAQISMLPAVPLLCAGANDPTNLAPNPCFDPSSGGLATSWTKNGTATASVTAVTAGYGVGNWQELTAADTSFSYLSAAATTVVGNVYEFACGMKADATGRPFMRIATASAVDPIYAVGAWGAITEADGIIVTQRFVATSTSTPIYLGLNSAAGAVGYRQVTVRDLTALGVTG